MSPFLIATRQLKFLIVGIAYFTKWVKVEAQATITEKNVRSFVWKKSSVGMGSLESWSQIMGNSSTTTPLGIFTHSQESRTTTPPPLTLKPTGRLRSRINPCLKSSRFGSRAQMVYGQKSCQVYYKHIKQQLEHLQEKHRFDQHMEASQSSQQRSDSRAIGWGNYDERKNDEAMRLHLDLLDEVRATVEQRLA